MTFYTGDGIGNKKTKKKYRGVISVTNEMLAQEILGLPEGVEVIEAYTDQRDITYFRLRGEEHSLLTRETGEGMEPVKTGDLLELQIKKAIRTVNKFVDAEPDADYGKMYRKYLLEVLKEDYNMNIPSSIKVYVKKDIDIGVPETILIEEDEIVTAFLNVENWAYLATNKRGIPVYIGSLNENGKIRLIDEVVMLKED